MQQLGFVRQVGELGHWAVGAHAFVVGSSFLQSRNLLAIVHPILRQLMEDSGETVNLAVLDQSDHQAIIIDQVQSRSPVCCIVKGCMPIRMPRWSPRCI